MYALTGGKITDNNVCFEDMVNINLLIEMKLNIKMLREREK